MNTFYDNGFPCKAISSSCISDLNIIKTTRIRSLFSSYKIEVMDCNIAWQLDRYYTCDKGIYCKNKPPSDNFSRLKKDHAGFKVYGLFAQDNFEKDEFIVNYVGEVISAEEYSRLENIILDASDEKYSNISRFANHSCELNAKVVKKGDSIDNTISAEIRAIKNIYIGDEITIDYQYTLKSFNCLCESEQCRYSDTSSNKHIKTHE